MAIAFGNITSQVSTTAVNTLSVNHTATTGDNRCAVVICHLERDTNSTISITSATYGGNAMTERVTIEWQNATQSRTHRLSIYTYVAPPESSTAVTWNSSTNAISSAIVVMSFTGVDQTTPYSSNASAQISSTSTPVLDVTTTEANTWIVGGLQMRGNDTDPFTPDAATERYDTDTGGPSTNDDLGIAGGTMVAATATTYDFGWTASASDGGVIAAIAIREATGAGVAPKAFLQAMMRGV